MAESLVSLLQLFITIYYYLYLYLKLQLVTFGFTSITFLCCIWKKCHNTHRQLLVSDVV